MRIDRLSNEGTLRRPARARRALIGSAVAFALMLGTVGLAPAASAAEPDLALDGTTTASASQNDQDGDFPASNATDGDASTRWASGNGPDEDTTFTASLTSDLGSIASVTGVSVAWEAAFAEAYEVQVATAEPDDPASWSTVSSKTDGAGGTEILEFDEAVQARYVRLAMLERTAATWEAPVLHYYGYSVFSFEVRGTRAVPTVGFSATSSTVSAGDAVDLDVVLSNAATADQTIRVATVDGSATAGVDFQAFDEVVSFPAGETTARVSVPTITRGPLAPVGAFTLTLSDPSSGLTIGSRSTVTVTVRPSGELPNDGATTVLEGFDAGVPADYSTWAIADPVKPVLTTTVDESVPGSGAGNQVLVATVGGAPAAGDWFGFTNDTSPEDWSAADGFSFWFLGQGTGKTLGYEVKSDGRMFDRNLVDDAAGWRRVSVLFNDLRVKGDPSNPARFSPGASTGFAVTLSGLGAGAWTFDDFGIFERAVTLEDFQGDVPIGSSTNPIGFFTWGSQEDLVTLGVTEQERADVPDNRVLSGTYLIPSGGYGGFSDNLALSEDWSSYAGIRFWWYASQPSNPASPTAGDDITVEIKDGGPDGEHSELWTTKFKDNWGSSTSRWKLVELPFDSFTLGAYQPGSAATQNGTLDLTSAWGFAPTFTPGKATATGWAIDDVQLYGTPSDAAAFTVAATQDVYLVDQGETATVALSIDTPTDEPLAAAVSVDYSTGDGTAEAGTHFEESSGTVVFPEGSESGSTQTFDVSTLATAGGDEARSIPVVLSIDGAELSSSPRVVINAHGLPYLDAELPLTERVDDLLARMSLDQKVGQMTQAERLGLSSPTQIAELGLGSVLSGGGSVPQGNTPEAWADMIDGYQRQALSTSLQIPLLYGADAVHGHSNVLDATIYPHNLGLGATRDPELVQRIAEDTASETKATGVNWAFAPCLCVGRDERWGRTYETFGEDPAIVKMFAEGTTVGLQGGDPADKSGPGKVLATAKHWAGDGGTAYDPTKVGSGYPIDQGLTTAESLDEFTRLHIDPYLPSIDAGVGSMMPSYSGVDLGDGDVRMHENTLLNTDVLKGDLGFDGFLISDWEGIDKLPGGTYAEKAVRSVNSGLDMAMAPYNFGAFITSITDAVEVGSVEQSRVDDAVRRILIQKFQLGLFEQPYTERADQADVGSDGHRAVARDAAAQSQVLLKNDDALPLAKDSSIYVAGSNADDLGNQMGGWTISWQGGSGDTTSGTSILEGIREVAPDAAITYSEDASEPPAGQDVGIVVVGETPYAEGQGDVGNNGKSLSLSDTDRASIDAVCGAMTCVVLVVAGRTQLVTDKVAEIDGLVASFLPGSEGAGVADVLFGDVPFTGRLPLSWPSNAEQVPINVGDAEYEPLYAFGWGERTDSPESRLRAIELPDGDAKDAVDALLEASIWDETGEVTDAEQAVQLAADAAELLPGTDRATAAAADAVISVIRDLAQDAVVAGTAAAASSALTADAEQALLSGRPLAAVQLLAEVLGIEIGDGTEEPVIVTPEAPSFTDDQTRGGGVVTIPETEGVEYLVDGAVASGDVRRPAGSVTVTARALEGFVIAEGATTSWTHTFPAAAKATASLSTLVAIAGTKVRIAGSGFGAGERVTVTLRSGVRVATVVADSRGTVNAQVTIPRSTRLGLYRLELGGANGEARTGPLLVIPRFW